MRATAGQTQDAIAKGEPGNGTDNGTDSGAGNGKTISLQELLGAVIKAHEAGQLEAAEQGYETILAKVPDNADPHRDILWITRAGALYPCYRTSTLIEHFQSKLDIPGVLFYPGEVIPPAGLSFMGVHAAEHNYRAKVL